MLTLGIPVLNRYDLLKISIESAERGNLKPAKYLIIDNGGKFQYDEFYTSLGDRLEIKSYGENLGVAGSWNKICENTSDIRIICNDDVVFFEDTIQNLVRKFDENMVVFPAGIIAANAFSCFIIPDNVLKLVGYFDARISPGYAYFEDNDYHRRMILKNISLIGVSDCMLEHSPSSTLKNFTSSQEREHHRRFKIAQDNYKRKWGGLPGHEDRTEPNAL